MIRPSKRARSVDRGAAAFALHLGAARRLAAHVRAWRAALGAFATAAVVAIVGRFVPVPVTLHLAALAAGAALGASLRPPVQTRRALDHIAASTGLAYESALGVLSRRGRQASGAPEAGAVPDEFGLEAALIARAERSVRDYEPERLPPWWLPVGLAAFAVVALTGAFPHAAPGPTARQAGVTLATPGPSPAGQEGSGVELAPAPPPPGRAEPLGAAAAGNADHPGAGDVPAPGSEVGNEALARYLEALRQGGLATPAPAGSGAAGAEAGPSRTGKAEGSTTRTGAKADGAPPGAEEAAEAGGAGAGEGQTPPGQDAEGPEGPEGGEPGQDAGERAGASQAGAPPEAGGADGERGLVEDEGGAGGGEPGERGAKRPEPGSESGPQGPSEDAASGRGGGVVSDTREVTLPATGVISSLDLLPGVVLDGPTTPAGNVRLPGDDQVDLPPGTALAPYATAAEEALGEGDLPADYQEIIRRYFR